MCFLPWRIPSRPPFVLYLLFHLTPSLGPPYAGMMTIFNTVIPPNWFSGADSELWTGYMFSIAYTAEHRRLAVAGRRRQCWCTKWPPRRISSRPSAHTFLHFQNGFPPTPLNVSSSPHFNDGGAHNSGSALIKRQNPVRNQVK